jgi:hypothetical protein
VELEKTTINQESWWPGRDLSHEPPGYESRALFICQFALWAGVSVRLCLI